MNSKIMQAKVENERKMHLEKERKNEILKSVCDMISLNRADIEAEILKIINFLNSVEDIIIKYDEKDQDLVYWHGRELVKELDNIIFVKMISNQLQEISENAILEIFGGINFFALIGEISKKEYKIERIMYIWKSQAVIKDIKYQFERIWNNDSRDYQVAVLKGMIALY